MPAPYQIYRTDGEAAVDNRFDSPQDALLFLKKRLFKEQLDIVQQDTDSWDVLDEDGMCIYVIDEWSTNLAWGS